MNGWRINLFFQLTIGKLLSKNRPPFHRDRVDRDRSTLETFFFAVMALGFDVEAWWWIRPREHNVSHLLSVVGQESERPLNSEQQRAITLFLCCVNFKRANHRGVCRMAGTVRQRRPIIPEQEENKTIAVVTVNTHTSLLVFFVFITMKIATATAFAAFFATASAFSVQQTR